MQLGVLGWCHEFSELVDTVKTAGNAGWLFTSTRDEGLDACEHILSLEIEIKVQVVTLYLRYVKTT